MSGSGRGVGPVADDICVAIVDFALAKYARPLNDGARDALTARLLDALGCAIASAREPEVLAVARAIAPSPAGGACSILLNGSGEPGVAAFLNGMMIRYHDWNDTYVGRNGGHPSDLIPVALAAGEAHGRSGDEVLRAIGVGTHLMLDMCDGSNALARGWDHATYVGLAAVVVAGLLQGLDRARLINALAMMAASNNMLLARSRKVSTWRSLASPHACRNALFLATLAGADVSGPDPVFQGRQGFLDVVSGDMTLELDPARDRSGDTHLKMYPAVFHAQAPVEIALRLRADLVAAFGEGDMNAIVETVEVATHAFAIKWAATSPDLWEPENRETADHSIAFMVALALCRGEIDHDMIEAAIHDPAVRALTRRARVLEDETHSARWPREAPAGITVRARGRAFTLELGAGRGHASRPLAIEDRARKLIRNAEPVIGADRARAWAERLGAFQQKADASTALRP